MNKRFFYFFAVVILVVVSIVTNKNNKDEMKTAGMGGKGISLKEMNDTTTTNVATFAEANTTTEGERNLFQLTSVGSWNHQYGNGFYTGADAIATISSEFGIMCPTYDVRMGANFETFKIEAKAGNYCRNFVKTGGFDPQFQNFCTISGEGAPVSNAIEIAFLSNTTQVHLGHQGGDKFYKFNSGNYYVTAEQKIKNLAISGGIDFKEEQTTGYSAVKLNAGQNTFTATANNLGSEKENYVLSYNHRNIRVAKDVKMNVGLALWQNAEKKGVQFVSGFAINGVNLFAEAGGTIFEKKITPFLGLGASYKL